MKNQVLKFKLKNEQFKKNLKEKIDIIRKPKNKDRLLMISIIINSILLILSFNTNAEGIHVISIFSIWITGILYAIFDIYERIFGFIFLAAFYNFLIGRGVLILTGLYEEAYSFTLSENIRGQRLILFSIYIFVYSYILINKYIRYRKEKKEEKKELKEKKKEEQRIRIQKVSRTIFYVTYVFLILSVLLTIKYVLREGYTSLYVGSYRKVNFVLGKIGDLAPIMFLAFLSTMPSKKQIRFPFVLYVIYLVLTVGIGARFEFIIGILTLFVYVVLRNVIGNEKVVKLEKEKEKQKQKATEKKVTNLEEDGKWFKLGYLKYLVILGIILVILLSAFNTIRFGEDINGTGRSASKLFTKFSYDQGISANMSKRIFKYEKLIPKDRKYTFCSTQTYYNLVKSRLTKQKAIQSSSEEKAIKTATLSDRISYIMFTEDYLKGNGTGTSYIAEVFFDFGYIGLFIVNVLYALLLVISRKMFEKGLIPFIVGITIFRILLKSPRSSTDEFIIKIIDPMIWISIVILILITKTKLYELYNFYEKIIKKYKIF